MLNNYTNAAQLNGKDNKKVNCQIQKKKMMRSENEPVHMVLLLYLVYVSSYLRIAYQRNSHRKLSFLSSAEFNRRHVRFVRKIQFSENVLHLQWFITLKWDYRIDINGFVTEFYQVRKRKLNPVFGTE